jgi:hypothetical protein
LYVIRQVLKRKVNGEYLVKGKNYWFSNTEEEEAVGLKVVPFLLEDKLQENGFILKKLRLATLRCRRWFVITGQNRHRLNGRKIIGTIKKK